MSMLMPSVVNSFWNRPVATCARCGGNTRSLRGPVRRSALLLATATLLLCAGGVASASPAEIPAMVDAARMRSADQDGANWPSYGRTYSEQRFSPLKAINADNAKQLGLAWYADLDTNRGQEAT